MAYRQRKGLNAKQQLFCEEYVKSRDVVKAYVKAGYSENSAGSHAFKLFKKPEVQAHIAELMDSVRQNNAVTVENVVESFRRIAEQCESEGNYKDALRAYENLAKYLGLYTEKVQISATHTVAETREEVDTEISRLLRLNKDLLETKGNA